MKHGKRKRLETMTLIDNLLREHRYQEIDDMLLSIDVSDIGLCLGICITTNWEKHKFKNRTAFLARCEEAHKENIGIDRFEELFKRWN